jgi:hypothetical protein
MFSIRTKIVHKETNVKHIGDNLKASGLTSLVPTRAIFLLALFAIYSCASNATEAIEAERPSGIDIFDTIVPKAFKNAGLMDGARFSFNTVTGTGEKHYVVKYLVPANEEMAHWIVAVSVAEAGKYIDSNKYDAIQKTLPPGNNPTLGKRYMDVDLINTATDFAPQGMFSGIVFTTFDSKYDIRILLSDMLPEDTVPPKFDHNAVGRMILDLYNKD